MMVMDGFFAAVAAMGFAAISNPPKLTLLISGILAALGYMLRIVLMPSLGIICATFMAALLISFGSIPCAKRWHIPGEIFAFPALLPMIPGMYAYKTILYCLRFIEARDLTLQNEFLTEMVHNGAMAFLIMCALATGVTLPLLAARKSIPNWWKNKKLKGNGIWAKMRKKKQ